MQTISVEGPSRPHISSVTSDVKERGTPIPTVGTNRGAARLNRLPVVFRLVAGGPFGVPVARLRRRWRATYE